MPIVLAEPSGEFLRIAAEQAAVYREYTALTAVVPLNGETGLGGKLVFAGDLAQHSNLLRAANIAGAASLAVSDDAVAGRTAMRDGVIDFLVTSLDEALRILKNEIRKRQPVSVDVKAELDAVVSQMLERGVLPDLLVRSACRAEEEIRFLDQGASVLSPSSPMDGKYVAWSVSHSGGQWLAHIDNCVRELFAAEELARDRWLRLASRYLGRTGQRQRGVLLTLSEAKSFRRKVEELASAPGSGTDEPVVVVLG